MTELRATARFLDKAGSITSPKLRARLEGLLELLSEVPTIGSALTRDHLEEEYGESCLTLDLKLFLIVYEYDDGADVVALYDIIRQRLIR